MCASRVCGLFYKVTYLEIFGKHVRAILSVANMPVSRAREEGRPFDCCPVLFVPDGTGGGSSCPLSGVESQLSGDDHVVRVPFAAVCFPPNRTTYLPLVGVERREQTFRVGDRSSRANTDYAMTLGLLCSSENGCRVVVARSVPVGKYCGVVLLFP